MGDRTLTSSSLAADVEKASNDNLSSGPISATFNRSKGHDGGPLKCYWKPKGPKSRWQERINIQDLKVGQELSGHLVEEFLGGKTGPKLFFDCGVGRTNPKTGEWSIVNGMLRLDRTKASVTKKRTIRYRKKDQVPLFVARIQPECAQLEVCSTVEDLAKYTNVVPKVSITSLKSNQEVVGEVVKLLPYGAVVDVGANCRGLLHITKVANLYGRYIDKEEGLQEAGLQTGTKVRLKVASINKRRLSLEFTDDVAEEAHQTRMPLSSRTESIENTMIPSEELAAWEEYAKGQSSDISHVHEVEVKYLDDTTANIKDEFDEDYDDDGSDEDADIEDAFGIGMY